MTTPNNPYDPTNSEYAGSSSDYAASSAESVSNEAPNYGGYPVGPANATAGGGWGQVEVNKVAPWALGLGIVALLLSWSVFGGLALGLLAVILGIIAVLKARKIVNGNRRMGFSVAGLILGVLAMLFSVGLAILGAMFMEKSGIGECAQLEDQQAVEKCVQDRLNQLQNN